MAGKLAGLVKPERKHVLPSTEMCAYVHQRQYQNVHRNPNENSPKLETTQMPVGNRMNTQTVVYSHKKCYTTMRIITR